MPAPIDDATRQAIIADIRAGLGRNAIARKHGVGVATVTNIARRLREKTGDQRSSSFDQSATVKAVDVQHAETARKHAEFARDLLDDAKLYARVTRTKVAEAVGNRGSMQDAQRAATILGIVTDKYKVIRDMDQPAGVEQGRNLVKELVEGLRAGGR